MRQIIQEKLKEIEKREKVKIILAVESGSRAWGFESKDSDYDVRFLYVREKEYYLKLNKQRDVIEWQLDEVLDINGWDIEKALRLLYKSNPTLFEWFQSPIVYQKTAEADAMQPLLQKYFSPKKLLFHYWHMANSNYREYLKGDYVKAKKYFYVLRPILASKWVITYDEIPPIEFEKLAEKLLDDQLKPLIAELLQMKKGTSEVDCIEKIVALNDYIEEEIVCLEKIAQNEPTTNTKEWADLNEFFLALLR
ncbi:hypothetical protein IGI37_002966 [Enterococcus sp. AZ194]|uniref:nucleotidyltransferase domain-containing protein n=1 Tax=Enterococcus sp. AZ194 TaxID=2774629 RepID=UPI003F2520F7